MIFRKLVLDILYKKNKIGCAFSYTATKWLFLLYAVFYTKA